MSKKINFLLLSLLIFPFLSTPAFASEVVGNTDTTPVTIDIIDTPIKLIDVTAPTFGTYEQLSTPQKVKATGNLIINVQDERLNKQSPWTLSYEISTFVNNQEYSLKINLGKGIAKETESGQKINSTPKEISEEVNEANEILKAYSTNATNYQYVVEKEKISLELPGNLPIGKFFGKQIVTLLNTPEVN